MRSLLVPGTLLYLAALVAFLGAAHVAARRRAMPAGRVLTLAGALVVAFLLGARLHYLLAHRHVLLADGAGGLVGKGAHMPGGIALGALVGVFGSWLLGLPVARLGDALMPSFGLGVVFLRLGCFANGCCFGASTDLPWGVHFAEGTGAYTVHMARGWLPDHADASLAVHPTQLYFAAVGVLIVLIAMLWPRVQRRDGESWLLAMAAWGFANPVIESLRDREYLTGAPHLAMAGALIGGTALLAFLVLRYGLLDGATREVPASPAPGGWG